MACAHTREASEREQKVKNTDQREKMMPHHLARGEGAVLAGVVQSRDAGRTCSTGKVGIQQPHPRPPVCVSG